MFELLQKLFIGHVHKYEIIEKRKTKPYGYGQPNCIEYHLQCTICGKIKFIESP